MNIWDMKYRTKTYLAGDWTGDRAAIQMLQKWNEDDNRALNFVDVHSYTSSSDESLKCSIKRSLRQRMSISKTFVLVVGDHTKNLRSGACYTCPFYNNWYWNESCEKGNSIDNRSYVQFECDLAKDANINIVVLYNSTNVDKNKCPESLQHVGVHLPMFIISQDCYGNISSKPNYQAIKNAINK